MQKPNKYGVVGCINYYNKKGPHFAGLFYWQVKLI